MHEVVIVGAGGLGREIYRWASTTLAPDQYRIKGFLSPSATDLDGYDIPAPILGGDDAYTIASDDRFLFAIGKLDVKKRIIERLKGRGAQFISLVHPTALVAASARLGEGVIICPFALVSDNVDIGDFALLNFYASCGHDAVVGRYAYLSPYATLNGFSVIEDEVLLGTHSTVTAYRRVGTLSKVNANSVVMDDVPPKSFVYGVPGKTRTIF